MSLSFPGMFANITCHTLFLPAVKKELLMDLSRVGGLCRVGGAVCRVGEAVCRVGGAEGRVGEAVCRVGEAVCRVGGAVCTVGKAVCRVGGAVAIHTLLKVGVWCVLLTPTGCLCAVLGGRTN